MGADAILTSGALTCVLRDAELRDIRIAGHPALDGVYATARDEHWGTIAGEIRLCQVERTADGFAVTVRCARDELALQWEVRFSASGGRLTVDLQGTTSRDIRLNRFGLCVLYPMELAGTELRAVTGSGEVRTRFAERISPTPLVTDVVSLDYGVAPGAAVEIDCAGDRYEMEDHRNWADPGWKMYSPPLRDPGPTSIRAGHEFTHRLEIRPELRPAPRHPERSREPAVELEVTGRTAGRVPRVGVLVDGRSDVSTLQDISPGVLSVHLNQGEPLPPLGQIHALADELGARVAVTVTGSPDWITAQAADIAAVDPVRVCVSEPQAAVPPPGCVKRLRQSLRARDCAVPVGGASTLFFAELNRMPARGRAPGDDAWDVVAFPVTPQVHHSDDERVMQSLLALPYLVDSARRIVPGAQVIVEPLAFRARRTPSLPARLDDREDPRERQPLGAAWLFGAATALDAADDISYLVDLTTPPADRPDVAVLRMLSSRAGSATLDVRCDRRRVMALAVPHPQDGVLLTVANLTAEPTEVRAAEHRVVIDGYGLAELRLARPTEAA